MERLLYAINAIKQPKNALCLGIFCGNTLTWNVGAASGPGKCYQAEHLVGVEIEKHPADLAKKNLISIGMDEVEVLCEDGFKTIQEVDYPIDLLYLDANGYDPDTDTNGKRIYLSMLKRALPKLTSDAVIIAHDTLIPDVVEKAAAYLEFVRDSSNFRASFSLEIDEEGLEVTFR
jgi:predicted O-methyltransferase YrrM